MTPLFADKQNQKRLLTEIRTWIGTPYRHMAMCKGRGVDCTLLIGAIFKDLGIVSKVEYDYYPKDWHVNTTDEFVLDSYKHHILTYLNPKIICEELKSFTDLMIGDIVGFALTKTKVTCHAGIMTSPHEFANSLQPRGTVIIRMNQYWQRHMSFAVRMYQ